MIEYTWLIPFVPMLCFVLIGIFGQKTPQKGGYIAIAGAAFSFILSAVIAYEYLTGTTYPEPVTDSIRWFAIGDVQLNLGYYVDGLTCMMMLFSSFISMLIFIYSVGYMGDQEGRRKRYYAEVSMFLSGMLGLIVSSNFLEMFIFWEIMGLCSYLLIGFWSFRHPEGDAASANAASAAKKAFLVTRFGDVCLMGGLFVLLYAFKSLDFVDLFNPANIEAVNPDTLTLGMLLCFGGVIGKSAQFPLHDWLPDAMAGPTTVSSLIHAATMVKAGVYLVARGYPLFIQNPDVMLFVGIIGGFTAFFTATMALNNMNIKRVLAYSTLSQLGYMIMSLGAGGYLFALGMDSGDAALMAAGTAGFIAGCFHMMNHAFFKALLFMCSGSVIHAVGTEDMRQMGGLRKQMPITSITMLLGSLSIAGFPFFSGFWSKDLVIEAAFEAGDHNILFMVMWVLAIITAFMTAFYMFRMWFMTFMGEKGHATQHAADHGHGESPWSMAGPLCVLAVFAVVSGFFIMFGLDSMLSFTFLGTEFQVGGGHAEAFEYFEELFTNPYTYLTIVLALLGIFIAYLMYAKKSVNPGRFNRDGNSILYKVLTKRWGFPDLYNQLSWKLGYGIARGVDFVDRQVVDGTVNGLSGAVVGGGEAVSRAQTGDVHDYTSVVLLGIAALSVLFIVITKVMGGI
ncbi:MAG: NADH-quinone oxidoreductase subunit L [Candidatus Methanomethylophilaceae archaeon]|jgi:NADH-quinone oxidoreductase subunit L|nr:NADH-quinone oxidoreductase subunit L [Candidatus Methanomethylophilaceae archaeon]MBR4216803.1 NADH-quinone oxidoreductase subunit L [Candidatus Methanomethylophilaceae archaeon]